MRRLPLHRSARITLAGVRLANGGLGLLAPQLLIGRFEPGRATSPAAVYAFRLFGIRTVLLGLDLLRPDRAQEAARDGVLIHASDTVTALALALSGAVPRRTGIVTTAISAGNVVLAVLAIEPRSGSGQGSAAAAQAVAGSPRRTATTPATTSTPPSSWTPRGTSPSSSQAKTSAASTSESATNEARRAPSRRVAAIPKT